ncbi:MAG: succinylglutamate desuccinylase/aspartoacylase family protein [Pseudomonadota bacterium]|nr:succinylglutamate desuccinylase/aspartoacylase family protein [Pseudomonadota bacterium]
MQNLKTVCSALKGCSYQGVSAVLCLDSGVEGPCVGITICTHGNEPCGLEVARKFIYKEIELISGKVFVVLNNIQATEKYFKADTEEKKKSCRFVDVNMNRLPDNLEGDAYEISRSRELLLIWEQFDYALDIHSTAQTTDAMIIEGIGDASHITKNLPVDIVIRNMIQTQLGTPAIGFYGKPCVSIGLEAGSHETSEAQTKAWECTLSLLSTLRMIERQHISKSQNQRVYTIHSSVLLPDDSYELVREFPMFGKIMKGEVIAKGKGGDILSSIDGVTILAPKNKKVTNYEEEALFICEEV